MELVVIVIALALIEYLVFTMLAGQARGRCGVAAPAIIGNPEFERRLRVQQNTLEQLIVFVPAILMFARYVSPPIAAGLGLVFILGRFLYGRGYAIDPARRGPGFGLTLLSNVVLLLGGLIGALLAWL
jgi:uncharacterized MAPEG superfamily protein